MILALQALTAKYDTKLSISYFLGIAIGPLVADLFTVMAPAGRKSMLRDKVRQFNLAPDVKGWSGYFPNPLKVAGSHPDTLDIDDCRHFQRNLCIQPCGHDRGAGRVGGLSHQTRLSPPDHGAERS